MIDPWQLPPEQLSLINMVAGCGLGYVIGKELGRYFDAFFSINDDAENNDQ